MSMIIKRTMADKFADLPERCAARLPSNRKAPIMIKRGQDGYYPAALDLDVDAFNAKLGITKAQVMAMVAGSMFGWDCPGADPVNYALAKTDPYARARDSRET